MKRFVAVALAAVSVVGLSGCDQFLPEPLAFTLVDSVVIVRTCVPLTITSQSIGLYSNDADNYDSWDVWWANGSIELPAGSEFNILRALDGFSEAGEIPADVLDRGFKMQMHVDAGPGGDWSTYSRFEPGDLVEGKWVDSYGYPLETPCTHEECSPMAACFNNWPQPTGQPTEARPTFTFTPEPTPTPTPTP